LADEIDDPSGMERELSLAKKLERRFLRFLVTEGGACVSLN